MPSIELNGENGCMLLTPIDRDSRLSLVRFLCLWVALVCVGWYLCIEMWVIELIVLFINFSNTRQTKVTSTYFSVRMSVVSESYVLVCAACIYSLDVHDICIDRGGNRLLFFSNLWTRIQFWKARISSCILLFFVKWYLWLVYFLILFSFHSCRDALMTPKFSFHSIFVPK